MPQNLESLIANSLNKSLLPFTLFLVVRKFSIEFPMSFSIDITTRRRSIEFSFVRVVESGGCQSESLYGIPRVTMLRSGLYRLFVHTRNGLS